MSAKLFVGNLDYSVKAEDLRAAFEKFGKVIDAVVISDRETGRSRGFGFIEFATEEEATAALALNGTMMNDRPINVNPAKPQENR